MSSPAPVSTELLTQAASAVASTLAPVASSAPPQLPPYALDGLKAQKAIMQCIADGDKVHGYLSLVSAACALVFSLLRLRNPALRKFPDNMITVFGFTATIWSLFGGLNVLTEDRIYIMDILCEIQAIVFQVTGLGMNFLWFIILIIMYQIIVQQVSIGIIRRRWMYYQAAAWVVPITTAIILLATRSLGPLPLAFTCYVPKEKILMRFGTFYVFYPILYITSFVLTLRMVRVLRGTGWGKAADERCRLVSRTYIFQVLGFTVILAWFMTVTWLYGFNSILADYFPASSMKYVAQTSYTYCMMSSLNTSLIGLMITILFGFNAATCQRATEGVKNVITNTTSRFQSSGPSSEAGGGRGDLLPTTVDQKRGINSHMSANQALLNDRNASKPGSFFNNHSQTVISSDDSPLSSVQSLMTDPDGTPTSLKEQPVRLPQTKRGGPATGEKSVSFLHQTPHVTSYVQFPDDLEEESARRFTDDERISVEQSASLADGAPVLYVKQ